ncbi:uncharacterized protein LOC131003468 isoform X1 [Salvia miltiorrhiza]|uniref:uncharacterized protein LOC131003468 isoform X1 n=1 Tax=Salvia miltiorrhiza TaxID=226208 RepID=UPI0025ABF93D|nr:uncharacterized protein LOC131003468 isoform X1 [Salvia miltiorrhiza]
MLRLLSAHRLSYSLPNYIVGKSSNTRFARAASGSDKSQTSEKTDQDKDAKSGANKPLTGGGYAKRSDEEGFGATYGGNQSLSKDDEDKIVHGNVPDAQRGQSCYGCLHGEWISMYLDQQAQIGDSCSRAPT